MGRRSKEHCNHKLRRELIASGRQQACRKCGGDALLEVHHILKYSDDGDADVANLDFLCRRCHVKWHRLELEYDVGYLSWVTNTAVTYRKLTPAQVAAIHEKLGWESPALIARMVALRWEGKSYQQIADILNAEGLRTVKGKLFHQSQIHRLIDRADPEANKQNNGNKQEDPAVVARAVALRWEGKSCQQIAEILNAEGLRTVIGKLFHQSKIHKLIARADPEAHRPFAITKPPPLFAGRLDFGPAGAE